MSQPPRENPEARLNFSSPTIPFNTVIKMRNNSLYFGAICLCLSVLLSFTYSVSQKKLPTFKTKQLWKYRAKKISLRQCLHGTRSVWNRYKIGTDKPCVYTDSSGSGTDRIFYQLPNVSTYESDPIWNRTVPVSNQSRVNRVDPYHSGPDPKRI